VNTKGANDVAKEQAKGTSASAGMAMRDGGAKAEGPAATAGAFGDSMTPIVETASAAVAAQAEAAVKSRYALAMMRPRDWDAVRSRLMRECKRPRFAEVARYNKPIGKGIEGPSIRFAEAALRCMGNVLVEQSVVYDDAQKRIIRITTTDLEGGMTYFRDVVVEKVVERSALRQGQVALSKRANSVGAVTYLVAATDDELLNKEGALASKAIRTCGLRLIPADLIDEAMDVVIDTLADANRQDPDATRKKMIDKFAEVGVGVDDLTDWLGHSLDRLTPAEYIDLRAVYGAIADGESRWSEVMAQKRSGAGSKAPPPKSTTKAQDAPDPQAAPSDQGSAPQTREPGQEP
jgi:hypothetical protein